MKLRVGLLMILCILWSCGSWYYTDYRVLDRNSYGEDDYITYVVVLEKNE